MVGKVDQVIVSVERKSNKNDGPSSSLKPSSKGKSKKYVAPLKPIDENVTSLDDARPKPKAHEEVLQTLWKHFHYF